MSRVRADSAGVPLTCTDSDGELVDASCIGEERWAAIYKVRPRVLLRCRECQHRMRAKQSKAALRFFAHDPGAPNCSSSGEGPEHRRLKALIVDAIRAAGWDAEPEVSGEGWRADVLASNPADGRRIAFEVQLAAMTAFDGQKRTATYAASGVETVWLTSRIAGWLYALPGLQVAEVGDETLAVVRGCLARSMTRWYRPQDFRFGRFLELLFADALTIGKIGWHEESVPRGTNMVQRAWPQASAWVKREHWAPFHLAAEQLKRRRAVEMKNHAIEMEIRAEQRRVSQIAMELAYKEVRYSAWVGSMRGSGEGKSDNYYAGGVPIFETGPRVWAVVCPFPEEVRRAPRRWSSTRIFVGSERERNRLVPILGANASIYVLPDE